MDKSRLRQPGFKSQKSRLHPKKSRLRRFSRELKLKSRLKGSQPGFQKLCRDFWHPTQRVGFFSLKKSRLGIFWRWNPDNCREFRKCVLPDFLMLSVGIFLTIIPTDSRDRPYQQGFVPKRHEISRDLENLAKIIPTDGRVRNETSADSRDL